MSPSLQQMLCPPGNGVYTVNTAKERKAQLHNQLYQAHEATAVESLWRESLKNLSEAKVALLGVCSDCGGGIQRGANWGPLFIRQHTYSTSPWFQEEGFLDLGDIRVIPHLLHDKYLNAETIQSCRKALYQDEKSELPVSPLSMTERVLDELHLSQPELKLLTLGGDHSVSYPAVKSYLKHKKAAGSKVALIHFDAHTDLLTERLGIDICFGSWVTHILDLLPGHDYCYQFGIRSSGKERNHWKSQFGLHQYWNTEFEKIGPVSLAQKTAKDLLKKGVREVYISFDIDALDDSEAAATGTPEPHGLKSADCLMFLETLKKEIPVGGADIMEVAPFLNMPTSGAKINPEPHSTLMAAGGLFNFFVESML